LTSPPNEPSVVTWKLSRPLGSVVPTFTFDPFRRGPFGLSAELPITALSPTLIYRSRARVLELKLAPDLALSSARISGDGTLSLKGVVQGTLAVQLGHTTVRATACGKSQLLRADIFHSVPTTGLITSLSGGISAELYQGREFRAATVFAKFTSRDNQVSLFARSEKVDPARSTFELRFDWRRPGTGTAALFKAMPGKPVEVTATSFLDLGRWGRIGYKGTELGPFGVFFATRDLWWQGVDAVAAVTFDKWQPDPWRVGVEFTVRPKAPQ
jgi:hypothetical protein